MSSVVVWMNQNQRPDRVGQKNDSEKEDEYSTDTSPMSLSSFVSVEKSAESIDDQEFSSPRSQSPSQPLHEQTDEVSLEAGELQAAPVLSSSDPAARKEEDPTLVLSSSRVHVLREAGIAVSSSSAEIVPDEESSAFFSIGEDDESSAMAPANNDQVIKNEEDLTLTISRSSSTLESIEEESAMETSSPDTGLNSLPRAQSLSIYNAQESESSGKPLSRAQGLKEKRREMEAWNSKQKSEKFLASKSTSHLTSPPKSPRKKGRLRKTEDARNLRMVKRLGDAEKLLQSKVEQLEAGARNKQGKPRIRAIQKKAETKLRISQIEKARDFYQQRLLTSASGPVPMEILKIVSNLPRKLTLAEELGEYMTTLKDEDRSKVTAMHEEIEYWEDDEDQALGVGDLAPDFCLTSNTGQLVNSVVSRKRSRLIVVFYHDSLSAMCMMNLAALEGLNKNFQREEARLVGIGFEADTKESASKSGASFPLLADDAGILATKFGIIRTEARPILSTFIIDTNGSILWSYVNVDYTQRPEPLDILEALPVQTKKRRFFGRSKSKQSK